MDNVMNISHYVSSLQAVFKSTSSVLFNLNNVQQKDNSESVMMLHTYTEHTYKTPYSIPRYPLLVL